MAGLTSLVAGGGLSFSVCGASQEAPDPAQSAGEMEQVAAWRWSHVINTDIITDARI